MLHGAADGPGHRFIELLHAQERDGPPVSFDDVIRQSGVPVSELRARAAALRGAREVVRPPVPLLAPTPGPDDGRPAIEVDGRDTHRPRPGLPGRARPLPVLHTWLEPERVVGRRADGG